MHSNLPLLLTLTGGLAAALAFGYLTQRLKLSPLVGYLLAGIAVGPFTPGFIADRHLAEQLAEVGVILLMFGVGLSFHLKELLAVRRIAIPGAIVQSTVATGLGTLLGLGLGWGLGAGLVFGLAISVASTVVLIRVLSDNNDLHTPIGHISVGWLVVEDLLTVLVLVILPVVAGHDSSNGPSIWASAGLAFVKIAVLVALTFLVGGRAIPWLLTRIAATRSRELFTLTVLVLALGIAVCSAQLFGVSMALGAFLAGMVVGRSDFSLRAATEALPMRDAFAVLFFVSVGMLFDWRYLLESPLIVISSLAIVILGKPISALIIVLVLRHPLRTALSVAVALAQIGEFSFILGAMAGHLGFLPDGANAALVATAILSISVNPLLYRLVGPLERCLMEWSSVKTSHKGSTYEGTRQIRRVGAVVVGYGPVGRTVTRLLAENGLTPVVVEMNLSTFQSLREVGIEVIYGDASHPETLKAAGIERADALILGASGIVGAKEIIRYSRAINPNIRVLARASYLAEKSELLQAGADMVLSAEEEIALGMTESILRGLGATPEQIDRERDRVHRELQPATDK